MTTSLYALRLGASDFTVGLLMALFAMLPMLLSVLAGRFIDRIGPRRPLLAAFGFLAIGVGLPFFFQRLETLYFSCVLIGTSFMFMHITMNSVFGAHGLPEQRAVNFSWLALGFSISNSVGPLIAGFALDHLGHARAMLALAGCPLAAAFLVWLRRRPLPRPQRAEHGPRHSILDLLRIPGLRHTFAVSALLAMGWDLYTFLTPLYGARLGLAASTIGIIMSTFALATFAVRLVIPHVVKHVRQWMVITFAMAMSGTVYLMFPYVASVPLLMALSFSLGLGLGCAQPFIMSLLYEAAPPGRQGEAVGLRTSLVNGSQTLIPLVSGAFSAAVGMAPVYWVLAAFLLGGSWFARQRLK
jgi:predicted MFS family arabinose efflux permease